MRLLNIHLLMLTLFFLMRPQTSFAVEDSFDEWSDLKTTTRYVLKGSYLQFTEPSGWALLGLSVPVLWQSFEADDRILRRRSRSGPYLEAFGNDFANLLNIPFAPVGLYYLAEKRSDLKLKQFAMEWTATLFLAQIESSLISRIQIHRRPEETDLSFFETTFRGDSSFPSGHLIGFASLTFKTLQFYGPYWAIPFAISTYLTGMERIRSRKHFASDVWGGVFLTALASEGVRIAAKYDDNHPLYKWLIERKLSFGLQRKIENESGDSTLVGSVSWTY